MWGYIWSPFSNIVIPYLICYIVTSWLCVNALVFWLSFAICKCWTFRKKKQCSCNSLWTKTNAIMNNEHLHNVRVHTRKVDELWWFFNHSHRLRAFTCSSLRLFHQKKCLHETAWLYIHVTHQGTQIRVTDFSEGVQRLRKGHETQNLAHASNEVSLISMNREIS